MTDTIDVLERQAENLTEEIQNSEGQLAEVKIQFAEWPGSSDLGQ